MSHHRPSAVIALAIGLGVAACSSSVEPVSESQVAERPATTAEVGTTQLEGVDEPSPGRSVGLCDGLAVTVSGKVVAPDLGEASGLAASVSNPDLVWATNDSGNASGLFALDLDGTDRGFFALVDDVGQPVETVDVEDLAMNDGVMYVADIGDNNAVRDHVTVLVVEEPVLTEAGELAANQSLGNREAVVRAAIELRYPDGPRDAEALVVDPISGDLVVLDKDLRETTTRVFVASPPFRTDQPVELREVGAFDLAQFTSTGSAASVAGVLFPAAVTAADISSSGSAIAVRTYGTVWLFERELFDGSGGAAQPIAEALQGEPCEGASATEPQGEALVFLDPGLESRDRSSAVRYLTISEGDFRPIHLVSGQ